MALDESIASRNETGPGGPDAAFLSRLLDALPDLVFAKDLDGRYLHVNRAFAEAMGRGPDAIVGRHDTDLRSEVDAARERAADQACISSREASVQPDGTRAPLRGPDGRPVGVAGSARATAGRQPRRSMVDPPEDRGSVREDRQGGVGGNGGVSGLESMLGAVPVAIYAKNLDGTYAGANAAFARLIGATDPREVAGRRDTDFAWRALDHPKLDDEVLHSGRARHAVPRREVDRFARRRWTETSVVPQLDELGRVTGIVGIRLDVTAHRNELAQVERARAAAERASRSKSTFLTQMSHELRTPLTSLLGFAELALEEETDGEARVAHLERIRDNGWQVLALVDDLLDLSRIESGRLATRARVFDPREVIDGLARTYGPRLRAAGLELLVEVDDAVPAAITSDPIRFRQILANLLERARAEVGTGRVTVRTSVSGQDDHASLVVEVRDEGPPLEADELSRRLSPFDQDEEAGGGRGGLGLGLAIAWSLADLLEGRIDHAPAADGEGCRFTLRLPVRTMVATDAGEWCPATREAHDPWQRVEAAARDGVAWFAPPPEDLDVDEDAEELPVATGPAVDTQDSSDIPDPRDSSPPPSETSDPPAPAPAPAPSRAGRAPAASSADGSGLRQRILLAEDTADTARFLMLVLRSRGHDVEHASDGAIALAMHRASADRGAPFDLVLTDVQMPTMDGLALTRSLRSDGWNGPIIALTAHASAEHRREAMDAGCDDHVAKPLTPEQLTDLIRRHATPGQRHAA